MSISTVKQFNISTISERRLGKIEFAEELKGITDAGELKRNIHDTISAGGRVYGIYKKKQLVGVYIFEKTENYFVKKEGTGVKLGDHEFDFDKFWYGSNTAAFCFKKSICLDEVKTYVEKIEKDLKVDLSEQIQLGNVAGVNWNNQLMYRRNLVKKSNHGILRAACGFLVGFMIGGIIFDGGDMEWGMRICFGFCYASMFGGLGIISSEDDIDTLDFINTDFQAKSEVEKNATK